MSPQMMSPQMTTGATTSGIEARDQTGAGQDVVEEAVN